LMLRRDIKAQRWTTHTPEYAPKQFYIKMVFTRPSSGQRPSLYPSNGLQQCNGQPLQCCVGLEGGGRAVKNGRNRSFAARPPGGHHCGRVKCRLIQVWGESMLTKVDTGGRFVLGSLLS
jgi:hypothetical protein